MLLNRTEPKSRPTQLPPQIPAPPKPASCHSQSSPSTVVQPSSFPLRPKAILKAVPYRPELSDDHLNSSMRKPEATVSSQIQASPSVQPADVAKTPARKKPVFPAVRFREEDSPATPAEPVFPISPDASDSPLIIAPKPADEKKNAIRPKKQADKPMSKPAPKANFVTRSGRNWVRTRFHIRMIHVRALSQERPLPPEEAQRLEEWRQEHDQKKIEQQARMKARMNKRARRAPPSLQQVTPAIRHASE